MDSFGRSYYLRLKQQLDSITNSYNKQVPAQVVNANPADSVTNANLASNDALARFDGVSGKIIQNSIVTLTDTGDMTGLNSISSTYIKGNFHVNNTQDFFLELPNANDGLVGINGSKYDATQNGKVLSMQNNKITPVALTPSDVVSSVSTSTNNTIALYDGTAGKAIKTSGVICDTSNNLTGVNTITSTGLSSLLHLDLRPLWELMENN